MRRRLITSTATLRRDVPVQVWSDRAIEPGDSWSFAIDFRLGAADVFIALISSEYLASEACVAELDRALELRAQGHIALVPILLETCDWRHGPLASIQLLPTDGRPISRWASKDQAWSNIVDELRGTFEAIPDQGNPQWTLLATCDGQDYRVPCRARERHSPSVGVMVLHDSACPTPRRRSVEITAQYSLVIGTTSSCKICIARTGRLSTGTESLSGT
jgi:hypothetical protein